MTVPPNYGQGPDPQHTPPGYGYGSSPDPQQPNPGYNYQPGQSSGAGYGTGDPAGGGYGDQYGAPSSPYGQPETPRPPKRNLGLIGGIVVGVTVVLLGAILLITIGIRGDNPDDDPTQAADDESSSAAEESTPADEESTEAAGGEEVGQCLPYEPVIADGGSGDGFDLLDCGDAEAFWTITAQSYDVADATVDGDGNLTDLQPVYDLCGSENWGASIPGEAWTNWQYVYSSGSLDSLYCIEAVGNPDPESEARTPYTPTEGDCFDESDSWWTVDCSASEAKYEAVGVVELDEPKELSDDEAAEQATCGGEFYWELTDGDDRTHALLCADAL